MSLPSTDAPTPVDNRALDLDDDACAEEGLVDFEELLGSITDAADAAIAFGLAIPSAVRDLVLRLTSASGDTSTTRDGATDP